MKYTTQCPALVHITIETEASSKEEALKKFHKGEYHVTDWSTDDPELAPQNITLEFIDELPVE